MALPTRRERILDATPRLFAAEGYASTSLRNVADAAGCSKSALYHHFGTKDDLLAALGEGFVAEVDAVIDSVSLDHDLDQDRVAVVQGYLLALGAHRGVARVLLLDVGTRTTPIGQRVVDQQRRLASRLAGPRASLREQVRARCALGIAHLLVGDLASVPLHRLRQPLLEAAIDTLVLRSDDPAAGERAVRWYRSPLGAARSLTPHGGPR